MTDWTLTRADGERIFKLKENLPRILEHALLPSIRPVVPDMPATGLFRLIRQPLYVAFALLRLVPRGTHDPAMFIKPPELRAALQGAGLVPGVMTGLGPRGINRRLDLTFGPLPLTAILYIGMARKPFSGAVP